MSLVTRVSLTADLATIAFRFHSSTMKFIHAADLHLDSPLSGLERYDGAPVDSIREAPREALKKLVRLAIDEAVDFVVIAGDLYDDDWKDHNTGLFFTSQMSRLSQAGIPLFLIAGNHDAANKMTRALRLPPNPDGQSPMLSHEHPETRRLDNLRVAIHGRSFANQKENDNLVTDYPASVPGYFNLGILHTCLTGESDHARYAPCDESDLRAKGYDYWALGHVHNRTLLPSEGRPLGDPVALFSGNIQGRHIRETGPKGCFVVEVDERQQLAIRFEALDVFRWFEIRVDCEGLSHPDEAVEQFQRELSDVVAENAPLPLGVRVIFHGACAADRELRGDPVHWLNEVRNAAIQVAQERVWIEKVKFVTTAPRESNVTWTEDGPIGELVRYLDELPHDEIALSSLSTELADFEKKLKAERLDLLRPTNPEWLRSVIGDLKPLLIKRLEG